MTDDKEGEAKEKYYMETEFKVTPKTKIMGAAILSDPPRTSFGEPTDYDKLKQLLTEFGVGFEEKWVKTNYKQEKIKLIHCKEGGEKIKGYTLFYTMFEFDEDGKFMQMGAWE